MAKTIGMWALWKNSTDAFDKAFLTIGKKYETIWLLQVCCCVRSNDCVKLLIEPKDRKSTRLNSSHSQISYAVFCLKKKKQDHRPAPRPRPRRASKVTAEPHSLQEDPCQSLSLAHRLGALRASNRSCHAPTRYGTER